MPWLFRLILLSTLFVAFLDSNTLPNGNFSAKEIGVYYLSAFSAIVTSFIIKKKKHISWFHWVDIIVICFLLASTLLQYFTMQKIAFSVVMTQLAILLSYFSLRAISFSLRSIQIVNIVNETISITLFFTVLIAVGQKSNLIYSSYKGDITGLFFNSGPFSIHLTSL